MAKQETRNVTFSPAELQAAIAQAIAEHEAQKAQQAKSDSSADLERKTVAAFRRKGFTDIQPRTNILTYARWVEAGRRVTKGERSVTVGSLRLYHISQTEPISNQEQVKYLQEREARIAAKTADKLPKPSPFESVKPAANPAPAPANPARTPRKSAKFLIASGGNA